MKRFLSIALCLFLLGIYSVNSPLYCKDNLQQHSDEAGFVTVEPQTFYFHYGSHFSRLMLRSSEARIWYSFHPADQRSAEKPLFVFFNGGPGSASSSGLMSMYTARFTLDNRIEGGGDAYVLNPQPWTQMGNLLYIDARQTGFSYNLMNNVQNFDSRFREFNSQNFNPFFDAADFIRVILRFFRTHPELKHNPVILVGESYGGIRATAMLHILLNYTDYGNGMEMYQDAALEAELQAHFDEVFPEFLNRPVPPEVITRQFGQQILIQPALSYGYQSQITDEMLLAPGALIDRLERETGIPYDPNAHSDPLSYVDGVAGRDVYIFTKPRGWLNSFFNKAARLLRYTQNLGLITETDVTAIPHLYASARTNAYRIFDTEYSFELVPEDTASRIRFLFLDPAQQEAQDINQEPGDMSAVFGTLQPWDRYFLSTNYHANWAFHVLNVAKVRGYEVDINSARIGRMFLQNVAHVDTFITNAALDLVVYAAAIPPALARHGEIVESVLHAKSSPPGEERPGQIVLSYRPGAFPGIQGLETRTIRFPLYVSSCHAVSLTQPEDLFHDVVRWLKQKGVNLD